MQRSQKPQPLSYIYPSLYSILLDFFFRKLFYHLPSLFCVACLSHFHISPPKSIENRFDQITSD